MKKQVKHPTREQVRRVKCPKCGALPGDFCEGERVPMRKSSHKARYWKALNARDPFMREMAKKSGPVKRKFLSPEELAKYEGRT